MYYMILGVEGLRCTASQGCLGLGVKENKKPKQKIIGQCCEVIRNVPKLQSR